jgi:cation-transporting P-type ATPase E
LASNSPTHLGLSAAEVAERVARGESNNYIARVGRTYPEIVRDNVFNLFNIVISVLLFIVLIFRDYGTLFFAGFSVFTNSLLGMFQEISAKRKLDQLAALSAKEINVWRDGQLVALPMSQLVKDDVIPIEPGDRLVVDGVVLQSDALEIDESLLTGESDAVLKDAGDKLFSGSFCIAGTGLMRATAVGKHSTINQLSQIAKAYKMVRTPTQDKISAIVELTVVVMFLTVPLLFIASYLQGQSFLDIVRNCVVFVSSLVPQGLVLTAVLALTLGAISITRHQTLIQRVNAVESMANVTTLCFDKTGTITRNQLAVTQILPLGDTTLDHVRERLQIYTHNLAHMNKTAVAIAEYTNSVNGKVPSLTKIREIPFTSARKWGAVVLPEGTLMMGAPERVLTYAPAPQDETVEWARRLSAEGLRVLALAESHEQPQDSVPSNTFTPLALVVMSDQVRHDIQETLNAFRAQNVQLKVISGDNLETVKAIATQAGMVIDRGYTGDELESMTPVELEAAVTEGHLFARISPDTKRKIIAALKNHGHYVAMVGDGVNDVPALKEANLAIAMNDGAQISKDVADIVLLNNAMSTLPLAFSEGRTITQTIYGTTKLFLVKNAYSILFFIFVLFMNLPFPITPIQISWVTFGTVNVPATLIAFNILRPSYMQRFRRDVLDYIILGGVIGAAALTLIYAIVYFTTAANVQAARSAVTMFTSIYGMVILWNVHGLDIVQPKTIRTNVLVFVMGLLLTLMTVVLPYFEPYFPRPMARIFVFNFVPPTITMWVLILVVWALATVILSVGLRNRGILNRMWMLTKP